MSGEIRCVSSRTVYENRWMVVREDEIERPDGSRGIYSVVDKGDFALVIPMENDGFHLVEQYRYPVKARRWEFPQGSAGRAAQLSPEQLAPAELAEETGLRAGRMEHLGFLHCAHGMSGQGFDVYLATELVPGAPDREHEEQDMRHQWFPRSEVERMIREGVMTDDSSVAAYALLTLRR